MPEKLYCPFSNHCNIYIKTFPNKNELGVIKNNDDNPFNNIRCKAIALYNYENNSGESFKNRLKDGELFQCSYIHLLNKINNQNK